MEFRHDMLSHGVYIITAQAGERMAGLAVAWGMQVAKDAFIICVGNQSATRPLILESGSFGLNVLRSDQVAVGNWFGRQSSSKVDKFEGIKYHIADSGSPILEDCGASYDCKVVEVFELGTQKLIVGKVQQIEKHVQHFTPLIYREEDYPQEKPSHPYT
jgi:flavin reductase (DIM6/NTAB) family NADH-FMN oxidoreductase RutF